MPTGSTGRQSLMPALTGERVKQLLASHAALPVLPCEGSYRASVHTLAAVPTQWPGDGGPSGQFCVGQHTHQAHRGPVAFGDQERALPDPADTSQCRHRFVRQGRRQRSWLRDRQSGRDGSGLEPFSTKKGNARFAHCSPEFAGPLIFSVELGIGSVAETVHDDRVQRDADGDPARETVACVARQRAEVSARDEGRSLPEEEPPQSSKQILVRHARSLPCRPPRLPLPLH
jgi:hypothetical protein